MKSAKYILAYVNHILANIIYGLFRILLKLGIFKKTCRDIIASGDLGYSSSEYENKNYGNALRVLRKYHNLEDDFCNGHIKHIIALIYYHGHGIEKNPNKAEEFFIQSAALGCSTAKEYIASKACATNIQNET